MVVPMRATSIPMTYPSGEDQTYAFDAAPLDVSQGRAKFPSRGGSVFQIISDPLTGQRTFHLGSKPTRHHDCAGFLGGWRSHENRRSVRHSTIFHKTNARHLRQKSDWLRSIRQRLVSSSRLTITCVSVGTALRHISMTSSNQSFLAPSTFNDTRATERCEWGVANCPRVWRACSDNSNEHGHVRAINIIDVHDLMLNAILFHKLKRDVIILIPFKSRPKL